MLGAPIREGLLSVREIIVTVPARRSAAIMDGNCLRGLRAAGVTGELRGEHLFNVVGV